MEWSVHGMLSAAMRWLSRILAVLVALLLAFGVPGVAIAASSTDHNTSVGQIALLVTAIFGGIGAVVGAFVTYLLGRRKNSGGVHTAEAETIFQAAEKLREEQRGEVVALRAEILSLRQEILSLRTEINRLRAEAEQLRIEANSLRAENTMVKIDADQLRKQAVETSAALASVQREMTNIRHEKAQT